MGPQPGVRPGNLRGFTAKMQRFVWCSEHHPQGYRARVGGPRKGRLNGPGVASWGEEQGRNMRKERQKRIRLSSPHGKVGNCWPETSACCLGAWRPPRHGWPSPAKHPPHSLETGIPAAHHRPSSTLLPPGKSARREREDARHARLLPNTRIRPTQSPKEPCGCHTCQRPQYSCWQREGWRGEKGGQKGQTEKCRGRDRNRERERTRERNGQSTELTRNRRLGAHTLGHS